MTHEPGRHALARLPKVCGLDAELGNFISGIERSSGSGYEASRALLQEIEGVRGGCSHALSYCLCDDCRRRRSPYGTSASAYGSGSSSRSGGCGGARDGGNGYDVQDWGRRFLPGNGGCAYIDLDHLELCLPEVLSAWDHVACWHAMLRITRRALDQANARLPEGQRIRVLVNNSDGNGNSYGSHLSFLLTRRAWANLFDRKMHHLLYLAAFQVSSIVLSGQGKVGSENGAPRAAFQISQRADFLERLSGPQTTWNRPIVNSRDEPLCGRRGHDDPDDPAAGMARLHVICFDNTLCHASSLLKVGTMQIVLAMIEAERSDLRLILDDPLDAVVRWSHDPTLSATARTCAGQDLTAVEMQLLFLEQAQEFVARGGAEGIVPRADEILALWADTLLKLRSRDFAALARRLDWVLKLSLLERARSQRPTRSWDDPALRHLDLLYGSLDATEGLYWTCERAGLVERIAPEFEIVRYTSQPPEDTRAWGRAMLLRRAGAGQVADVDWDSMRFVVHTGRGAWDAEHRTLEMPDPTAFTRREVESILGWRGGDLAAILDAMAAHETTCGAAAGHDPGIGGDETHEPA